MLIQEIGPTADFDPVDNETLKAMTIAARTVAYKNCGIPIAGWPYTGMDDNLKQVYNPTKVDNFSQAELSRYQQAINDTVGMYLTYNSAIFDAQYRDKSDNTTDDVDENGDGIFEPHKGIYDPAGQFHATPVYSTPGLMQVNSNHWATSENHGQILPKWNYQQILGHYYTSIHLKNLTGTIITPDYRWNPLMVDWGNGALKPPNMQVGRTYTANILVQNTGVVTWSTDARLSCQWKKPDGTIVNCETEANPGILTMGSPALTVTLPVSLNNGFTLGLSYTLMIDMKQGATFFHNREAGKPWPTLDYKVCAGSNCRETYLPIIMKNSIGAPCDDYTTVWYPVGTNTCNPTISSCAEGDGITDTVWAGPLNTGYHQVEFSPQLVLDETYVGTYWKKEDPYGHLYIDAKLNNEWIQVKENLWQSVSGGRWEEAGIGQHADKYVSGLRFRYILLNGSPAYIDGYRIRNFIACGN